ncbi:MULTISPECIES: hypothetical protein [Mycolicibacterium]|uniref:Uncharacterized protein n=2 Tax=Mycolicibacterium gilvum TaxID=1804 RepID=A0A378SMX2_9MYCO|nr:MULTISPECIES: hypothetical protein [Mycolicibacterium]ABP45682.1 hypothetical protein Mflv_3205 [Mycolicibacterium gilvum PYR-GCK]MBV5246750.1 hypothetical protein [Mycolicibacterium sp. PAM1]MCV7053724.1 hypothetical protein [Mycolicibacterium gilvum]STZ43971.1 Uncharacterised protein [Mycolicibacterium gilvum]
MTTSDSLSISLTAALSSARVPAANYEFIREMTDAVGIAHYRFVDQPGKPYVIATRRDGLRDLHIYYGATNGFYSEDDIVRIFGDEADRRLSGSRKGTWCVIHPVHQSRPPGAPSRDVRREGTLCDCGMQRSLTGVCGSCD